MPKAILTSLSPAEICSVEPHSIPVVLWFYANNTIPNSIVVRTWSTSTPLRGKDENNIVAMGESFFVLSLQSIVRFQEGDGCESIVHTSGGDFFTIKSTFEKFANSLTGDGFFLIHPEHLININHLKSFVQCNAFVTLTNSDALPVSLGNDKRIIDYLNSQTIL